MQWSRPTVERVCGGQNRAARRCRCTRVSDWDVQLYKHAAHSSGVRSCRARSAQHQLTGLEAANEARRGRYVQTVDFSACQATAGETNVERSCSRGTDESVLSVPRLWRCGTGRGRPTGRSIIQRYRSPVSYRRHWQGRGSFWASALVLTSVADSTLHLYSTDRA